MYIYTTAGFYIHFLVQMSRKMCHHDRSIISSPLPLAITFIWRALSYIIRVLRKKKKPGHYLIIILPLSLLIYIFIRTVFIFIFWVVGYSVSCRCCSARHFLYNAFNFCANDPCALEGCALTHTNQQQHPT